ncbi:MAG: response regulator [Polyangiaceae bacterium]|nr:response regulator [Polyangiaceae bacterium]
MPKASDRDDPVERPASRHSATPVPPGAGGLARLVVTHGLDAGRRFVIDRQAVVGRAADATVSLGDGEVSRRHARIFLDGQSFIVEDLESANGTFVNGARVTRAELAFGDEVRLGSNVAFLFAQEDGRRAAELQRQRLAVVGHLATGSVHDFNNMLGAALANLDILDAMPRETHLGDPLAVECSVDARAALRRAAELAARLLRFSRAGRSRYVPVDLSAACDGLVRMLRRTLDPSVRIETDIAPGLVALGDECELHQVLMNLCLNACDAMPGGGRLVVRAALEVSVGRSVLIEVEDTGVGMDDTTLGRLFEPFFTTKEPGQGVGLGLASVHDIVTLHGGTVRAVSTLGAGSSFTVRLPALGSQERARAQAATARTQRRAPQPRAVAGMRVLVADDEPMVRRSIERALARAGCAVVCAADGAEALALVSAAPRAFDALVLDLEMPRVRGDEVLGRAGALGFTGQLVVVSGHPLSEQATLDLGARGAARVLTKPFGTDELLEALRAPPRAATGAGIPALSEPSADAGDTQRTVVGAPPGASAPQARRRADGE